MKTIDTETLLDALKWRYATKGFDPSRKVDAKTWHALEETLLLAPSSFGLQPWKFIVVTNPAIREQLLPLSWGQRQVVDASHLVVFTVRDPITAEHVRSHVQRTADLHDLPLEKLSGFEKVVNSFIEKPPYPLDIKAWSTRQVYLALGGFMTAAALLGVDTCPMEGLDPAGYDKVLGLEGTGYYTVAACPAGYRFHEDKAAKRPKVRFAKEVIIEHRA